MERGKRMAKMASLHAEGVTEKTLSAYLAVEKDRKRILNELQKLEEQSHRTRTPLYQETMFEKVRAIVSGDFSSSS
jgi:hypothetical protein